VKLLSDFKFLDNFRFLARLLEFFRRTGIFFDHLVHLVSPTAISRCATQKRRNYV
jgi:hypothetical protein